MIETNWSPEFQHLILAAALRGDLLRQIPLDPALFSPRVDGRGGRSPEQQVAEIAVKFYETYARTPTWAEFKQLLVEARPGPERQVALDDLAAEILTIEVPEDLTSILDTVREQLEIHAIEKACEQAYSMLGPDNRRRRSP